MPESRRPKTLALHDLLKLEFPPENYIIGNGLLSRNSIMIVAAPPKSYKSFSLNTMLVELLTGGNLFNIHRKHNHTIEHTFPINPVKRVLLIEQEIGLQDTQARFRDLYNNLPPLHQEIVGSGMFIRSCDYDLRFDKPMGIEKIASVVAEVQPDIVCIDPLTKFHTSDENSPSEMGKIMLAMREMIHKHNTTIILLHHIAKNEEGKSTLDMLRGASSIAADIDTGLILHVVNKPASIIWVDIDLRRGKPCNPFKLKLNHQTLRTEFHGWGKGKGTYQAEASLQLVQEMTEREQ